MRYLPKSPAERQEMLAAVGLKSIDELFSSIPERFRLREALNIPGPYSEAEVIQYFKDRAAENSNGYTSFLGAGVYNHLRSVVTDAIIQRGEFLTSYTPYQAEISQGTLQAIFEFQTLMCQLTGQEVANASMADGSTATTAAVVVPSPNFFGVLETLPGIADAAHGVGALLVVAIAEGVSLGAVKPPAEADIVALEAQSFGLPPSYGGPYAGVIASRDKFVRQMPGRLAGETTDTEGKRGFVLTLATREQHIRREKATSNICTNQALCALAATVHLTLLGKEGLREMAEQNVSKAQFAIGELEKIPGVKRAFDGPFFNEFTLEFPRSVRMINAELLKEQIAGPLALGTAFPELTKHGLVCVTETTPRTEIERFAAAVKNILSNPL